MATAVSVRLFRLARLATVLALGVLGPFALIHGDASASGGSGQVYAFGDNFYGELASMANNGTSIPNPAPSLVAMPAGAGQVAELASGAGHTLAVTSSGQLYAFGRNEFGELGVSTNSGSTTATPTPTLVSLPGATGPVVQVAAGTVHSLALTSTGQLFAFGDNNSGQLGIPTNAGTNNANSTPALVTLPGASGPVISIAAGTSHSLALTSTGQLYAFGSNTAGQLGTSTNAGNVNPNATPTAVALPAGATGPVSLIAAGGSHSVAVTSTSQLVAFGDNRFGQLGDPATSGNLVNPTPVLVTLPGATGSVTQVVGGRYHTLVVTSGGQLFAFGHNYFGQLGNGTNVGSTNANVTPVPVTLPGATGPVVRAAAGEYHSLAVTATGQLYSFGENHSGQLGNSTNSGSSSANPTPTLVVLPGGVTADTVASGSMADFSVVAGPGVSLTAGALPAGTVGVPYQAQLQPNGGTPPDAWSATGLPPGLSIDASTGVISGTPTHAGSFDPAVTVTDRHGLAASASSPIAVSAAPGLSTLSVSPRRASTSGRMVHGRCAAPTARNRHHRPCVRRPTLLVAFSVSAPTTATFSLQRLTSGRRVRGACVAPTHADRRRHRCTRVIDLPGTLQNAASAGQHSFRLTGSFTGHPLTPGTYRLTGEAGSGPSVTATFTIAR